ncbi:hypothetical protein ACQZV8_11535 [Magnetococcales bacterium HHB-1]
MAAKKEIPSPEFMQRVMAESKKILERLQKESDLDPVIYLQEMIEKGERDPKLREKTAAWVMLLAIFIQEGHKKDFNYDNLMETLKRKTDAILAQHDQPFEPPDDPPKSTSELLAQVLSPPRSAPQPTSPDDLDDETKKVLNEKLAQVLKRPTNPAPSIEARARFEQALKDDPEFAKEYQDTLQNFAKLATEHPERIPRLREALKAAPLIVVPGGHQGIVEQYDLMREEIDAYLHAIETGEVDPAKWTS